jgi:hypothetical protein
VARICAAVRVTLILLGWALAQFPYLVEPDIAIYSALQRGAHFAVATHRAGGGGARTISFVLLPVPCL